MSCMCCNTELGVIRIALRIAYFDIFLIIKNIFKCGMKTQRFWKILCQTFLLNLQSNYQQMMEYLNRSGASPSLDANSQLSSRVCKSVAKIHWWQFYTIIMFYSIEITNICYQVFILKLISCYSDIDSIKTCWLQSFVKIRQTKAIL